MLAEKTAALRGAIKQAESLTNATDRYVDYGIEIRPAKQDFEGGSEVLEGKPPLSPDGDVISLGGIIDTLTHKIVAPSDNPIIWYVSKIQLRLLMHDVPQSRILIHAAEGAGKSHTLAMHSVVQVIENLGFCGYAGLCAPTGDRLRIMLSTFKQVIPIDTPHNKLRGSWATYYGFGNTGELRFKTGITIQFRSTHQASAALGSPIQGSSWLWADVDELQDVISEGERDADIEARLRVAPNKGMSKRLNTATAKDTHAWRNYRDQKRTNKYWTIERMPFDSNLVIWPAHWETMQANMTIREWRRRGLALEVAPEKAVYYNFERRVHVRPRPLLGVQDVTSRVLGRFGGEGFHFDTLVGHDPGSIVDVSVLLRCYQMPGIADPVWVVIGELTTEQTTAEMHASALKELLQRKYHTQHGGHSRNRALVLCDPANEFESKDRPHLSTYKVFKRLGFNIASAEPEKHVVPKLAGAEMINTLLRNVGGDVRLYLDVDENGVCVAPNLLRAMETQERSVDGQIEWEKKSKHDTSHWTASLRYALWRIERVRMQGVNYGT